MARLRHRRRLHAVHSGQRHQRRIQRVRGDGLNRRLVPHGVGVIPHGGDFIFRALLRQQLIIARDGGVQNAFVDKAVKICEICFDIGVFPGSDDFILLGVQCDGARGKVEPLRNTRAEGAGVDEQYLVLLPVAVRVLGAEITQHLCEFLKVLRLVNFQGIGPVTAVQNAEAAVGIVVVTVVFVLHIAEPVHIAVLGRRQRTHTGESFVERLPRGACGIFIYDFVDRND